jgi:hypothetical protein
MSMMGSAIRRALLLGASAAALAACSVPPSMQVRSTNDPDKVDDYVRFRTTYYFRVFDACEGVDREDRPTGARTDTVFGGRPHGPYRLRTDSLYRFHMTGKGSALANRIHFESGSLHRDQIEPFGANVVFDKTNNRFFFKSREETEAEAKKAARHDELAALRNLRRDFLGADGSETAASRAVDEVILAQIAHLKPTDVAKPAAATPAIAVEARSLEEDVAGLPSKVDQLRTRLGLLTKEIDDAKKASVAARNEIARGLSDAVGRAREHRDQMDQLKLAGEFNDAVDATTAASARELLEAQVLVQRAAAAVPTKPATNDPYDLVTRITTVRDTDPQNANDADALAKSVGALQAEAAKAETAVRDAVTRLALLTAPTALPTPAARAAARAAFERGTRLADALVVLRARLDASSTEAGRLLASVAHHAALNAAETQRAALEQEVGPAGTPAAGATHLSVRLAEAGISARDAAASAKTAALQAAITINRIDEAQRGGSGTRDAADDAAKKFGTDAVAHAMQASTVAERSAVARDSASKITDLVAKVAAAAATAETERGRLGTAIGSNKIVARVGEVSEIATPLRQQATRITERAERHRIAARNIGEQAAAASGERTAPGKETTQIVPCPKGTLSRRGFQILGPEGWRTFDQDERLLMAMSSSAKPLIGMLNDLSNRVLNAKPNPSQTLLPLVQEQLRTREAIDAARSRAELEAADPDATVDAILAAFARGTGR